MACAAGLVMRNLLLASRLCLRAYSLEAASPPAAVRQGAAPPPCTHLPGRVLVPVPWGVGGGFALGLQHVSACCCTLHLLMAPVAQDPPVAWVLGSVVAPGGAGCLSGELSSSLTILAASLELEHILKESFQVS